MLEKSELLAVSLNKQFVHEKSSRLGVVSALCGLQAQFANYPRHALRMRAADYDPATWNAGLVKTWTFRGTLHLVPKTELGLFLSAMGVPDKWDDNWNIGRRQKPRLSGLIMDWIRGGACEREELKSLCRGHGVKEKVLENVFHGWGGLLKEMCQRGLIVYAPGTKKHFLPCDGLEFYRRDAARATLLERYFHHLGPATMEDCATFFGCTRKSLTELLRTHPLPLKSVTCEGVEYWYLGEWNPREIPSCLFLAGFDQLLLAYKDRSRLVDDKHRPDVVTNTGIIHPTVLVEGRLRAKWKLVGKTVAVTPFTRLGRARRKLVADTAMRTFAGEADDVSFPD
jgi:hypothetical protein